MILGSTRTRLHDQLTAALHDILGQLDQGHPLDDDYTYCYRIQIDDVRRIAADLLDLVIEWDVLP